MKLMTNAQRTQLLENGRKSRETDNFDPTPVVKLFTPDANATWLLTELDPAGPGPRLRPVRPRTRQPRTRLREPRGARRAARADGPPHRARPALHCRRSALRLRRRSATHRARHHLTRPVTAAGQRRRPFPHVRENRPPRKPQDQRSHPTPWHRYPCKTRPSGSPMASELQSSVRPQSARTGRGLACSSQGATPFSPSRRSVAPFGPLLAESRRSRRRIL